MKTITAAILFLLITTMVEAQGFQVLNYQVEPGGVLLVKVDTDKVEKKESVYVFDKVHPVTSDGLVVIGVPVNQEPKTYLVYLINTETGVRDNWSYQEVKVLKKDFSQRHVGILREQSSAYRAKRLADYRAMEAGYQRADEDTDFTQGTYQRPLDEIYVTEEFGLNRVYLKEKIRIYNKKTRKYKIEYETILDTHKGIDLRAREPKPVKAINSGQVVLVGQFTTEGKMMIICHRPGVFSLYLHLSEQRVKVGDIVTKNQVIALTGATPRGASPHLHLMVKVGRENVDPLVFIDTMNRHLE